MTLEIRDLPRAEWEALRIECFDRDDWTCVRCGCSPDHPCDQHDGPVQLEGDHVRSIKRYPELALDLANLQTLCKPCNQAKSDADEGAIERLPWVHPAYDELRDLVFSDRLQPARSLVPPPHTESEIIQ